MPKKLKIKKISDAAGFLLANGLVFEINRRILHPFGLALEVDVVSNGEHDKIVFGRLWDCRDDPEGLLFSEEALIDGEELFGKFLEEFGNDRLKTRQEKLGFIYQEIKKDVE